MTNVIDTHNKEALYAIYPYHCRAIMLFSIVCALIGNISENPASETICLIITSVILLYILTSYAFRKHHADSNPVKLLNLADGFLVAISISHLSYSPWPALLLITLIYFHALYQGGRVYWLLSTTGLLFGALTGFFILQNQTLVISNNIVVNLCIGGGAFFYICIYAIFSRRHYQAITDEYEKLSNIVTEQKLQAYEISQYLPKTVWEQIESKRKPKIERKPITVFFSDIVGFSSLSEELEAETLSGVLSSYLGEMSKIVEQYNGTIDKFIGDAIMVTFGGDGQTSGIKKDAVACVSMALAMSKRMRELQGTWQEMGIKKSLEIRMGINSGYCTVGTFGISQHLDHTALGVHVNLASRLESAAKPGEILVSHETWSLIKDSILCKDKGYIKAKGFTHPVQVYTVVNHRKELGGQQSYFSHTMDGFSMYMDMEKLTNYDHEKILNHLEEARTQVRKKLSTPTLEDK